MGIYILNSAKTISAEDTLNTIVDRYPQALPALRQFGLDTCCGGALSLQAAAAQHDLDLQTLIAALHRIAGEER